MSDGIKKTLISAVMHEGYVIRKERWSMGEGDEETEMESAYTHDGAYIGNPELAQELVDKRGIAPELRTPDSNVCSIGWCDKEGKWYGWSHRAMYGFGIGSEVKRGDCAYVPVDLEDARADAIRFWDAEDKEDIKAADSVDAETGDFTFHVTWKYDNTIPNKAMRGKITGVHHRPPDEYGKGEWIAATVEDAKQMACDFAAGVS